MAEEKLSVSASSKGFSVQAEGGGADRLANALADFLSPVADSAGILGDNIRMYRAEAAMRYLARAKAQAIELGLDIQPVAPKFLVDWCERASLEDDEGSVGDMWSGVLLSAGQGIHSTHYLFKRVLSEITAEHARTLLAIAHADDVQSVSFDGLADHVKLVGDWAAAEHRLPFEEVSRESVAEKVVVLLKGRGVLPYKVALLPAEAEEDLSGEGYNLTLKLGPNIIDDRVLTHLESLGLVRRHVLWRSVEPGGSLGLRPRLKVDVLEFSELGRSFLKACAGGKVD